MEDDEARHLMNNNIWDFSLQVSRDLLRWNVLNILGGSLLLPRPGFWRGFGSQNIGWGMINIGIALFGRRMQNKRRSEAAAHSPSVQQKEATNLRRILLINAGLDVVYILGGWRFANNQPWNKRQQRGMGFGIMLQGFFLLIFDLYKASRVPGKF
jgi:hypothetical protein